MGSKMPNCLRTAMNRMMTTPMANSSMPWIAMTSGRGGSPLRAKPTRRGLAPRREAIKEVWTTRVKLGSVSQQQVFSTEAIRDQSGRWLKAWVCFSRPGRRHESQASELDEGCSNVNTDAEVENMWTPTYMENLPL